MATIRNLVLGGGGIAGALAYPGALKILRLNGILSKVERVVGTSVGAIVGLMVCLHFNDREMRDYLTKIHFPSLQDGPYLPTTRLTNFTAKYGIYYGNKLLEVIKDILKMRDLSEDVTFAKLRERGYLDLYVTATKTYYCNNIEESKAVYFSWDTTPDTPIAPIILASASATPYFPRVRLEEKAEGTFIQVRDNNKGFAYSDGGFVDNLPIDTIFDAPEYCEAANHPYVNPETLGLALSTPIEINPAQEKIISAIPDNNPTAFIYALLYKGLANQTEKLKHPAHRDRTILIDRKGIKLADFDISVEKQKELYASGIDATYQYLKIAPQAAQLSIQSAPLSLNNEIKIPPDEKNNFIMSATSNYSFWSSSSVITSSETVSVEIENNSICKKEEKRQCIPWR